MVAQLVDAGGLAGRSDPGCRAPRQSALTSASRFRLSASKADTSCVVAGIRAAHTAVA